MLQLTRYYGLHGKLKSRVKEWYNLHARTRRYNLVGRVNERRVADHVTKLRLSKVKRAMSMALWDMGAQIANYTLHAALMSSGTSGYQARGQKTQMMPARQLSGFKLGFIIAPIPYP